MCLNDDSCHSCPFISSLRALAKQSRKKFKNAVYYYKEYGIWPFICFTFATSTILFAILHHSIDTVFCALMALFVSAVGLSYKAHSDKEQKNEPIFKARKKCFDELENIVQELYFNLPQEESKKRELIDRATTLFRNVKKCFSDEICLFIDGVRGALIHYLRGMNGLHGTALWKGYVAANEFLMPFLRQKEFLNRRREFELDMFKPETFDPIWAKPFDNFGKERRAETKSVS